MNTLGVLGCYTRAEASNKYLFFSCLPVAARGELSKVLHWKEKHEEEHAEAQEGAAAGKGREEKEQAAATAVAKKDE